jgi:hypothetical protein
MKKIIAILTTLMALMPIGLFAETLCIGDSQALNICALLDVHNHARGKQDTVNMNRLLSEPEIKKSEIIIIGTGTHGNMNYMHIDKPEDTVNELSYVIERIKGKIIYLLSALPTKDENEIIPKLNEKLMMLVDENRQKGLRIYYLDIYSFYQDMITLYGKEALYPPGDNIHPSELGYQLISIYVRERIK